ncbi:MAG: tetratricopeptide repeat protein, partial [Candidatus Heimdallarchaeota archaeon]
NIHYIRGEYDLALKKYAETIILKKEVEHNVDLSAVLSNIGAVHLDKGELNKALAYFNQSLRYISNSNDEAAKAFRYINIGRIYIIKGDLDIALDFLGKASEVYKNLENKFLLARSLSFTGSIYLYQKKLDLAEKYLLLSLEYHNSFENAFQVSKTLYIMIQVKVEQVQRLEASSYLQRLKKIEKQKANPIVTLRYLLAKALIYKRENRLSRKYSAMELYQKIIQNPLLNGIIKMEAKLGFCELLIMEFELLMNPILPDEIFALIDQIYKYGQQEQAYTFIINGLILKSRMVFIQKEITKAYKLLEIADFYCDERQLSLCKSKIGETREVFNSKTVRHQEFISSQRSQLKPLKNQDILEYLEDLKNFKFKFENQI